MPWSRLFTLSALVCLVPACGSDPVAARVEDLVHAVATRQCGPADGPAVSIYLAAAPVQSLEPSPPYVRLDIWRPVERLTDRPWSLGATGEDGGAVFYPGAAGYEVATGGRVRVTGVAADNTLTGSAEVDFPTIGRVQQDFAATWIATTMLCG